MKKAFVHVSKLGQAFLPSKYTPTHRNNSLRQFDLKKKGYNQPFKYLKQGGSVVLEGSWPEISSFYREVNKFEKELLPKVSDARQRKLFSKNLKRRVLVKFNPLAPIYLENFTDAELAGFLGETTLPRDSVVLIPVEDVLEILNISSNGTFVEPLGINILTHNEVLAPRSQETINLICQAIKKVAPHLSEGPKILDMGCGSGILSIATHHLLKTKFPKIVATDILKEAIATTKYNIRQYLGSKEMDDQPISTTLGGDLYEPVRRRKFDLIIFNAPWVVAPAKNRSELALNDQKQRTIKRFFAESPKYMSRKGRLIVGYSDHSGQKAVENLESSFREAGLETLQLMKDRIKTYRSKRPWQNIYAYVLSMKKDS